MTFYIPGAWSNWLGDHSSSGWCFMPNNKEDLINAVRIAVHEGYRIRAVGSGHSHSAVAQPKEAFIRMTNISGAFPNNNWMKSSPPDVANGEELIRVKAGTTIKRLNREILPARGLALPNMGGFDGQTLAGAINTATHGTGVRHGSLADAVVSMDIVAVTKRRSTGEPHVQMHRIEPTNGVTDPAVFNSARDSHGMVLHQDDDLFYGSVVGYGCIGVVFSYILKVQKRYWLDEKWDLQTWPTLRNQIDNSRTKIIRNAGSFPSEVTDDRHYWFLLNIAQTQGNKATNAPICGVCRRNLAAIANPSKPPKTWPPERRKTAFQDAATYILNVRELFPPYLNPSGPTQGSQGLGDRLHNHYFKPLANKSPFTNNYTKTESYIAHRRTRDVTSVDTPPDPQGEATSLEIGVPATQVTAVVNALIQEVQQSEFFWSLPVGVRFAPSSRHVLASNYGRGTAYVELAMLLTSSWLNGNLLNKIQTLNQIAKPELVRIDRSLREQFDTRPHLGKCHGLQGRQRLQQAFPELEKWLRAFERFNAFGTFDNAFVERFGLRA
jgi:L-gulono-1,4-lactone dehydrogenase